jgi:eukaryotic-like serine/threonine-protein kinase
MRLLKAEFNEPNPTLEAVLFEAVLAKASATERAAFLDGVCRGKPGLRHRLDLMLEGHFLAEGFLWDGLGPLPTPPTPLTLDQETTFRRVGRYRLLEKIGEGGFGEVWLAEQEQPLQRRVALKIIKLGMDTRQWIARFEVERQTLALMDHPNIAKVLDGGATSTGRPYFVMEMVRGVRITEFCDRHHLPTRDRLLLFIQVCRAIQHAHQKGIIHRDIKPSNILVAVHDGAPVPKVIDFGIAKVTQQQLSDKTVFTQFQQLIGTPAYISPEQAEMSGLDIDTRSDIYSLGVLLYELLTGTTPFDTEELMQSGLDQMRQIIRERNPVRPSFRLRQRGASASPVTRPASLPTDLDWIVMKCLEKDRSRRYETANGLAMDIERHLRFEPVVARPPSRCYEFQRSVRRHWVGFGATAGALLALALGVTVSTCELVRARKAERQQAELRQTAQRLWYTAQMNLAQQAYEENHMGQVRHVLAETAAYPERGFEWYYWQRQTHLALKTLRGHLGAVAAVALSPDGRQLVSGSEDGTAILWDALNGKELFTLKAHRAPIRAVAFSPDSLRTLTVSVDRTARVWDVATGSSLFALNGPGAYVTAAAFSPNGRRIATGSQDGTAKVWSAADGQPLLTFKAQTARINWLGFTPDGQRIITASADGVAKVWEATQGTQLFSIEGHTAAILSTAIYDHGRRIVTASADGRVRVWDMTRRVFLFELKAHSAPIVAVAITPDDQRLVTASADRTAKVWSSADGKPIATLEGHSAPILALGLSPDGSKIVTGSEDQTARVWETASGRLLLVAKDHSAPVSSAAFSSDAQRLITGSADHTIAIWDLQSADQALSLVGHADELSATAFSPDGKRILTGSFDQTAKLWLATSGNLAATFARHDRPVRSVAFSPDHQRIATASGDDTVKVWAVAGGNEPLLVLSHNAAVLSVAFSPEGHQLLSAGDDKTAKVWDSVSGHLLVELRGHSDSVFAAAFSPDGQRIVTGSRDQTAQVWDAINGNRMLTLTGHLGCVSSVAFSPNGRQVITGSWDKTGKVWDAVTGRPILTLIGHNDAILAVALSPDGQRILTGSRDRTATLWDTASGQELLTLRGHTAYVTAVAFSPDGQRIITASGDHTAKVWETAPRDLVAGWQREEQQASQRLADLSRERATAAQRQRALRAQDPGAIKQWLVLAPLGYAGHDGARALAQEQIPHEAYVQARAGTRLRIGSTPRMWRAVQMDDYVLDFNLLLGASTRWSVAYAICYIFSEADRNDVSLAVGSDDQSKIYLNGNEVYRCDLNRSYLPDQDVVPGLSLKAGLNVLVFKVVNQTGEWLGSIRLTDPKGRPLQGIRVTIDPR